MDTALSVFRWVVLYSRQDFRILKVCSGRMHPATNGVMAGAVRLAPAMDNALPVFG
jgi:hypothetical protein